MRQLVDLERLADEVGGASLDRLDRVLHRAVAGHHDGHDVRIALDGGIDHVGAADARQPEVGHDGVEREVGELGECCFSGFRLFDGESPVGQLLGHGGAQGRLVFD